MIVIDILFIDGWSCVVKVNIKTAATVVKLANITHAHMLMETHTHARTCARAHTHTHTHTRARMHAHTRIWRCYVLPWLLPITRLEDLPFSIHVHKGLSPITGILFQTNDVRLRGGRVEACSFGRKIGIFGLLRVVLHDFPVVWVTKKSIILQTSPTGRPSCPSLSLSTSSAVLTRKLHDLAPSVMRRTNVGRPAPTPLKKTHTKSPSVEPGTSHLPWNTYES